MLIDWQQERSLLHIAGDSRFIGIWDLSRELKVADLATTNTTSSNGPLGPNNAANTSSGSSTIGQQSAGSSGGQLTGQAGFTLTTALCSRENIVAAGFTDGSVKIFDTRTPSHMFVYFKQMRIASTCTLFLVNFHNN